MSKLDWSRAGIAQSDPARVQKVVDFVTPDNEVVSVRPLTRAELAEIKAEEQKRAKLLAARRASKLGAKKAYRKRQQAAENLKRAKKLEAAKLEAEKKSASEQARQTRAHRIAAREAAELAHKQTPEYIAAQKIKEERLAAAEQKRQDALRRQREPLRQLWREKLLNKPDAS